MLTMLTVCLLVQEKIKGHGAAPPSAHPPPSRNRPAALSQPSHTYLRADTASICLCEDLCSLGNCFVLKMAPNESQETLEIADPLNLCSAAETKKNLRGKCQFGHSFKSGNRKEPAGKSSSHISNTGATMLTKLTMLTVVVWEVSDTSGEPQHHHHHLRHHGDHAHRCLSPWIQKVWLG